MHLIITDLLIQTFWRKFPFITNLAVLLISSCRNISFGRCSAKRCHEHGQKYYNLLGAAISKRLKCINSQLKNSWTGAGRMWRWWHQCKFILISLPGLLIAIKISSPFCRRPLIGTADMAEDKSNSSKTSEDGDGNVKASETNTTGSSAGSRRHRLPRRLCLSQIFQASQQIRWHQTTKRSKNIAHMCA